MSSSLKTKENSRINPITAEVIRCGFENIADEMSVVLLRTSGSPVLTEAKDFSAVVFDAKGRQIGAAGYVLAHLASSRIAVKEIIKKRLPSDLRPGDIFICNDPYTVGALHQGDVGIVMPIHMNKKLVGWTFTNAHLIDVGGSSISGIAPEAHDCFEEAIRFPGVRVGIEGILDKEWIHFVSANVRVPASFINDVRSLIAACHAGSKRIIEMFRQYGENNLLEYIDHNIGLSRIALSKKIDKLPQETFRSYDWVEYDGRGQPDLYDVFCEMTAKSGKLKFKFSGVEQVAAFVNAGPSAVAGMGVITPLLCMLAYDIPFNEGIWECLEIDVGKSGTIVNPIVPAPVTNAHMETGVRLGRMVAELFSESCLLSDSESINGRIAGQAPSAGSGAAWFGTKADGSLTVFFPLDNLVAIGGGAQSTGDGQDLYGYQGTLGVSFPDVEVHELADPFLILWRRFRVNSGGAGLKRGGLALDQAYTLYGSNKFIGSVFMAAAELPARGFGGGLPGGAARTAILRKSNIWKMITAGSLPSSPEFLKGNLDILPAKISNVPFNMDDVYWATSSGGGGLGDPFLRNPELVEQDLRESKISVSAAKNLYGAIVQENDDVSVDHEATWKNRESIRTQLVPQKKFLLRDVADRPAGRSLILQSDRCLCGICKGDLGPSREHWHLCTKTVTTPIAKLFQESDIEIRERIDEPVHLQYYYCPHCGSCLSATIKVAGRDSPPPSLST